MRLKTILPLLPAAGLALLPTAALAHPGHDHMVLGFLAGALHPLLGFDHLLGMIVVGIFAVQLGGRALWLVPATFMAAMAMGALAASADGTASIVEPGIALSVVLFGAIVALQLRPPLVAAMALVGTAALLHGHAHGSEAVGGVSVLYLAGFLLSTATLLMAGIAAGLASSRFGQGRRVSAQRARVTTLPFAKR